MLKVDLGLLAGQLQHSLQRYCQVGVVVVAYPHLDQITKQIDLVCSLRFAVQQIHEGGKDPCFG